MQHNDILIGRQAELKVLKAALQGNEAEMVAVIGRRRVGKTFLVRQAYKDQLVFEISGLQGAPKREQLAYFAKRLAFYIKSDLPLTPPADWLSAFQQLIAYLQTRTGSERIAIFFDELPWLATHRSGFLRAFGAFWNDWAVQQNIVVVICGSAASWMIRRVVRNKGGLYNRITRRIHLRAFDLAETATYLAHRNVRMDHYQIIQLYMTLGGIPHYLKEVKPGWSATQNIEAICFSPMGILRDEFSALYYALFDNAEQHVRIIRALSEVRRGLTRVELVKAAQLSDGGSTTTVLEELVSSDFVRVDREFGKKRKEKRFRLSDEYSLFYLQFIENTTLEEGSWERLSQTQRYRSWSGYAFESLCLKHVPYIRRALGISGTYTEVSTYYRKGDAELPGTQIDLLLDRADHVINVMELKFYQDEFVLDKAYAATLRRKLSVFRAATNTKKQLHLTLLTTFPMIANKHSGSLIDKVLTMEVLFGELPPV